MVWLPSNYLNLYLHDNELVQYKAAIIGTKNTKGTDGNFWSRVLGAVYNDYSLENKNRKGSCQVRGQDLDGRPC